MNSNNRIDENRGWFTYQLNKRIHIIILLLLFISCIQVVFAKKKNKNKKNKTSNIKHEYISRDQVATKYKSNEVIYYDFYYKPDDLPEKTLFIYITGAGTKDSNRNLNNPKLISHAKKYNICMLSVNFKSNLEDFKRGKSFQYAQSWSGRIMRSILEKIEKKHNIQFKDIYLFGHSAGAQFVLRYSIYFPSQIKAVWGSAPGGVEPVSKIYKARKLEMIISVGKSDPRYREFLKSYGESAKKKYRNFEFITYEGGHGVGKSSKLIDMVFKKFFN